MVLISLGAIITALLVISVVIYILGPGSSTDPEAGIVWWGFFNMVFAVMLTIAWMQYSMNRHWENFLQKHGRGEFVQKSSEFGPYLEFQLIPSVPVEVNQPQISVQPGAASE